MRLKSDFKQSCGSDGDGLLNGAELTRPGDGHGAGSPHSLARRGTGTGTGYGGTGNGGRTDGNGYGGGPGGGIISPLLATTAPEAGR